MKGQQLKKSLSTNSFSLISELEAAINTQLVRINTLYADPLHEKIFESIGAKAAYSYIKKMIQQMNVNLIAIDLIIQKAQTTNNETAWINTLKQKHTYIDNVFNDIVPHKMLLTYIDKAAYPSYIDKNQFKAIFNGVIEKARELETSFNQKEISLLQENMKDESFTNLKSHFNHIHHGIIQMGKLIITKMRGDYAIDPNQYAWAIIAQINLNHFEQELTSILV